MRREKQKIEFFKILSFISFSLLFFPLIVFAQVNEINYENLMVNLIAPTPIVRAELLSLIFNIIRYLLGFLGVVAVIILIYGGFLWMTAKGDEERVRKAKKTIINGLIGLIIILLSYAIVSFVMGPLLRRELAAGPGEIFKGAGPGGLPKGANYLVITSRYPKPNETTPQNIKIVITFNQNIKEDSVKFARPNPDNPQESICSDWNFAVQNDQGEFIDGSFKVIGNSLIFIPKGDCPPPLDSFKCEKGEEGNCFLTFKKSGCCSCFSPGNDYKISLIAYRNRSYVGILGKRAFGNKLYKDEIWQFNVANYLDTRAPAVENNLPQGENVARNVGILVTFTKEVDPSTLTLYNPNCVLNSANCNKDNCGTDTCLSYAVDDFNKASVRIYSVDENGNKIEEIPGFFERFSTKSFLFRPSTRCGEPGSNLYFCRCLPPLTRIKVELVNEGEIAIRDVNCNSLDCTNGKCSWIFKTSETVDITPPKVETTDPENNEEDVDRLIEIKVNFSEEMDPASINEDTFVLLPETLPREIKTENNLSTFTPSKILDPDKVYTPIIYGGGREKGSCDLDPDYNFGVRDLAGNAMVGNYIWQFKTGWQVNQGNPYIDWISPTRGPKGECVTIHGYNLGCCSPYLCQTDFEAQRKEIKREKIGREIKITCQEVEEANYGKTFFCAQFDNLGNCVKYTESKVLSWQEINKPEKCFPPNCPENCLSNTCPSDCSDGCRFCSDPNQKNCGECFCPMPKNYSPENQIIVTVPEGAVNRSPSSPGQIKVVPAQK
jgi:hypothetical protein